MSDADPTSVAHGFRVAPKPAAQQQQLKNVTAAAPGLAVKVSDRLLNSSMPLSILGALPPSLVAAADGGTASPPLPPSAPENGSSMPRSVSSAVRSAAQYFSLPGGSSLYATVASVQSMSHVGTCGNGVCELNERPVLGHPNRCPGGFDADCLFPLISCPAAAPPGLDPSSSDWHAGAPQASTAQQCGGRGLCFSSTGTCLCFPGYAGFACERCDGNHTAIDGWCVRTASLAPCFDDR